MRGILRTALAVTGLGCALSAASLSASEPNRSEFDDACNVPFTLPECAEASDVFTDCDTCDWFNFCDQSSWSGYVGAIFLTRGNSHAGRIIAANPAGTPFLTGSNFDFGNDTGTDVSIAHRLANGDTIEGRYFGVDEIFAGNTMVTPGSFIGVGFTGPAGTTARSSYWTQIKSAELNYKTPVNERLSVLAGFRYLQLNDTLSSTLNGNVATGRYEFENEMYGGQLGLDLRLTEPTNALDLRVVGKAGFYSNHFGGGIEEFQGNNFIGSFGGANNSVAFVGDMAFSASYWFNDHVALRAGYQLLWIGDVALAGEEASRSILNPSLLRDPNHGDDLFMHGAMVGLEFQM